MSKPTKELSKIRAQVGALGGKTVTPKKVAHLASIASKGGQTVTEKKREHLRKALAARWAKAKEVLCVMSISMLSDIGGSS